MKIKQKIISSFIESKIWSKEKIKKTSNLSHMHIRIKHFLKKSDFPGPRDSNAVGLPETLILCCSHVDGSPATFRNKSDWAGGSEIWKKRQMLPFECEHG